MLLSLTLQVAASLGAGTPPPSFVVVLMDDVGRDKVAAYGDHPQPAATPNMDRLAAKGVLFRNAWACASCSPTRATLLTGRFADRTGIGTVIRATDGVATPLARDEMTIPKALPNHTSLTLGKWHLADGGDSATHANLLGFDAFLGWSMSNDYFNWTENNNGTLRPRSGYYPLELSSSALRVIEHAKDPYFLYYCPLLAHHPFHEPPAQLHPLSPGSGGNHVKHLQMVESMDTILGRLLDTIDLDTTYLFVIGDNGSPSGTVTPPFAPGHVKGTIYEGGVRVPFLVAGPGVAPGAECEKLVQVTDLFATIVDLAGAPPVPRGAEDSISFAPLLANPAAQHGRHWMFAHRFPFPGSSHAFIERRALRTDRWKMIDNGTGGDVELYDLANDPFETMNLMASQATPAHRSIRDRLLGLMPKFP